MQFPKFQKTDKAKKSHVWCPLGVVSELCGERGRLKQKQAPPPQQRVQLADYSLLTFQLPIYLRIWGVNLPGCRGKQVRSRRHSHPGAQVSGPRGGPQVGRQRCSHLPSRHPPLRHLPCRSHCPLSPPEGERQQMPLSVPSSLTHLVSTEPTSFLLAAR